MNYRPYWLRHPIQRRILCAAVLPLIPFLWVALTLWQGREDLFYEVKRHVKAMYE